MGSCRVRFVKRTLDESSITPIPVGPADLFLMAGRWNVFVGYGVEDLVQYNTVLDR